MEDLEGTEGRNVLVCISPVFPWYSLWFFGAPPYSQLFQLLSSFPTAQLCTHILRTWFEWLEQPTGHPGMCFIFLPLSAAYLPLTVYLLLGRVRQCPSEFPSICRMLLHPQHFRDMVKKETWRLRDMILAKSFFFNSSFFALGINRWKELWLQVGTNCGLWICFQWWSSSWMQKLLQTLPR